MTRPQHNVPDPPTARMIRYRPVMVVAAHGAIFALALFSAFLIAYNFHWTVVGRDTSYVWFFELFAPMAVLAVSVKLIVFRVVGQYRGSWRYVGLRDLFDLTQASLVGTFFFLVTYFVLESVCQVTTGDALIDYGSRLLQSAVFVLDWGATVVLIAAARVLVRFYYEDIQPNRSAGVRRVLILGAGDAGEAVLRELLRMRHERYQCVGFLDDDLSRIDGRIHGVDVLGQTSDLRSICDAEQVQEVFIAIPQATPKMIRSLVEQCEGSGVRFRTIPAVSDVIQGKVQVSGIREVEIADLLGRDPVELDVENIGQALRGKRALVTGAGGSIGSEMCRQIAGFEPARLILLERAENALFEIERELRKQYPELSVVACVADVCDRQRLANIVEREAPSIIFHAAAHKHVPMMECNAGEAVKNNIGGTVSVADVCIAAGVAKMVMISTDKAVNPTSVMGCTKRVAEMYVQSVGRADGTQFVTVRFGNVLGSSGSVVQIFKQQIAEGGPITVTHPDMLRYFMSIPEAAQLVLQAGSMAKGGEIYVLDMGEPVRIVDLARDMITLSGLRPGEDIDITFDGVRPGEKLFEELSNEDEDIGDTAHAKIGIWKHRPEDAQQVRTRIERLMSIADESTSEALKAELRQVVPEYEPPEHDTDSPKAPTPVAPTTTPPKDSTSPRVPTV